MKNVVAWTNLGLLYLHHDDVELANEVLYRAQTLDPDHEAAWIGQALVATANNHDTEADAMFEHAIGLTASSVRRYAIYLHVHWFTFVIARYRSPICFKSVLSTAIHHRVRQGDAS